MPDQTFNANDYVPNVPVDDAKLDYGIYLARVIGHFEPNYMGILDVQLIKPSGNTSGQTVQAKMLTPFYGVTGEQFVTETDDYNNTQKSYGMWMCPPDVGTIVVVIFINGNTADPYWIGCVPQENMNFMLPGLAATEFTVEGTYPRAPVAEYNRVANGTNIPDATKVKKATHPLATALNNQGLIGDDIRGITTSSARREIPSMVFGISTPGPIDKQPGSKKGSVGKDGKQANNVPVSRLGGTTFVMDDGDDKYIRKQPAGPSFDASGNIIPPGPPDYEAIEYLSKDATPTGNVTIPHNELFRIRTRTGHQILLHNSEDLIYIGNAAGTSWIEMSGNGKIDIFAGDSISVHTGADLNFYADRDINMEAGRNINLKSTTRTQVESLGDFNFLIGGNYKVSVSGDYINVLKNLNVTTSASINLTSLNTNLYSSNNILMTATTIGENGPPAATAVATAPTVLSVFDNFYNSSGGKITSIMKRIPNHEPWPQHENLDPTAMTPAITDREVTGNITFTADGQSGQLVPKFFNKFTATKDTFRKGA